MGAPDVPISPDASLWGWLHCSTLAAPGTGFHSVSLPCPALKKHKLSFETQSAPPEAEPFPCSWPSNPPHGQSVRNRSPLAPSTAGLKGQAPCPAPRMLAFGRAQSPVICVSDSTSIRAGLGTDRRRRVPAGLTRRTSQMAHTQGWLGDRLADTLY